MKANEIIFIIELILVFILVIYVHKYYSKKPINCLISFIASYTILSMFLFIIFAPYDIETSYYEKELKERNLEFINLTLEIFMKFIYFISLIYGWFLSDFISYYDNSKNFNICSRTCGALCDMTLNLLKKGIYVILGIIILFFLIPIIIIIYVSKSEQIKDIAQKILGITSFPGIIFFVVLIGMSLFRLPKDIYYRFDFNNRINYLNLRMGKIVNKLNENKRILFDYFIQLDKTVKNYDKNQGDNKLVRKLSNFSEQFAFGVEGKSRNIYNNFIKNAQNYEIDISEEHINERIKEKESETNEKETNEKKGNETNEEDYIIKSTDELGKINQTLRKLGREIERLIGLRNIYYNEWIEIKSYLIIKEKKDILLDKEELIIKDLSFFKQTLFNFSKTISIILIIIIIILNLGILFLEFLYSFPNLKQIENPIIIEKSFFKLLLLIPFFYLIFLSLYSLFSLNMENNFYLYDKEKTDEDSVMYITKNLMRISAPACIHIIKMLNIGKNATDTRIEKLMGFSSKKNQFFVKYVLILCFILIVVLSVLNLFDIPKQLMNKYYYKNEPDNEKELIEIGNNTMIFMNKEENYHI